MQRPDLKSHITKANSLVPLMSRYSLQDLRLIAYCLAHYDSRAAENRKFTARVADLAEIFDMGEKTAHEVVQRVVDTMSKPVKFQSEEIEPFLLELKERFSVYRLADVHQFKSASTWHLFENLNRWKNAGGWYVSLKEMRSILGVDEKYPRFNSFREFFIDPAIEEINEKSCLHIEYLKETSGKTVVALRFFIDSKQPDYVITIESQKNRLLKILLGCGIRHNAAEHIINQIVGAGREEQFIKKIPEMQKRWCVEKGSMPRYVAGAIKRELAQRPAKAEVKPEHMEALNCWMGKRQKKEVCKVRQRGGTPYRKKCQICLSRIPVADWGL
jgi:hypothetical protein